MPSSLKQLSRVILQNTTLKYQWGRTENSISCVIKLSHHLFQDFHKVYLLQQKLDPIFFTQLNNATLNVAITFSLSLYPLKTLENLGFYNFLGDIFPNTLHWKELKRKIISKYKSFTFTGVYKRARITLITKNWVY